MGKLSIESVEVFAAAIHGHLSECLNKARVMGKRTLLKHTKRNHQKRNNTWKVCKKQTVAKRTNGGFNSSGNNLEGKKIELFSKEGRTDKLQYEDKKASGASADDW